MSNQSLICPVTMLKKDTLRALAEVENFAEYMKLPKKTMLHLRLAAEELLGMVGVILNVENGRFWIEENGESYELHLSMETHISDRAQAVLVKSSTDQENFAYKGMMGRMRMILDIITNPERQASAMGTQLCSYGEMLVGGFCYYPDGAEWSYLQFKEDIEQDKRIDRWDELELSVLNQIADNIVVSVRNDKADIVVILYR